MSPEDLQKREIAFTAYHTYKNATVYLAEKFGDDFTAFEELFALLACVAKCAVACEVTEEYVINTFKMMYTANIAANQVDAERKHK